MDASGLGLCELELADWKFLTECPQMIARRAEELPAGYSLPKLMSKDTAEEKREEVVVGKITHHS
jgi:hypothetical protein